MYELVLYLDVPEYKMEPHPYNNRIVKELAYCKYDYPHTVKRVKAGNDNCTRWEVTLINGVKLELFLGLKFPFYCPFIKFKNFDDQYAIIRCECEHEWFSCGRIGKNLLKGVYTKTQAVFEKKRAKLCHMGLLRTIPMMMLWRKRATERVYHPSRIDFAAELRELNALLF